MVVFLYRGSDNCGRPEGGSCFIGGCFCSATGCYDLGECVGLRGAVRLGGGEFGW